MADIFNIAGEINSTSQEGTAVHANQVKDDLKNKKQSQINEEVGEELELHTNRLNALTGQNYITVQATQSTTAADIPTLINASGEGEQADTLYRVGFWDGSAYVADKYTEYAWNGTAYVVLDVKSSIGEVFDISQYNAVGGTLTTYADLEAALGVDGANVPSSVRRGGMSIKFVQTSDNKYVQYRLMATDWSTVMSDWQGVDGEPTHNSPNIPTSKGTADLIAEENAIGKKQLSLSLFYGNTIKNGYSLNSDGHIEQKTSSNYRTVVINNPVNKGAILQFTGTPSQSSRFAVGISSVPITDENITNVQCTILMNQSFAEDMSVKLIVPFDGYVVYYRYINYWSNITAKVFNSSLLQDNSVLDVSELNDSQYASLSEAIAAVPETLRKGGMAIRYIDSNVNKYVQRLYMGVATAADAFTNVANWQAVKFGSGENLNDVNICNYLNNNDTGLITQKAVRAYTDSMLDWLFVGKTIQVTSSAAVSGKYLKNDNTTVDTYNNNFHIRTFDVKEFCCYSIYGYRGNDDNFVFYLWLDENNNVISYNDALPKQRSMSRELVKAPAGAVKLRVQGHDVYQQASCVETTARNQVLAIFAENLAVSFTVDTITVSIGTLGVVDVRGVVTSYTNLSITTSGVSAAIKWNSTDGLFAESTFTISDNDTLILLRINNREVLGGLLYSQYIKDKEAADLVNIVYSIPDSYKDIAEFELLTNKAISSDGSIIDKATVSGRVRKFTVQDNKRYFLIGNTSTATTETWYALYSGENVVMAGAVNDGVYRRKADCLVIPSGVDTVYVKGTQNYPPQVFTIKDMAGVKTIYPLLTYDLIRSNNGEFSTNTDFSNGSGKSTPRFIRLADNIKTFNVATSIPGNLDIFSYGSNFEYLGYQVVSIDAANTDVSITLNYNATYIKVGQSTGNVAIPVVKLTGAFADDWDTFNPRPVNVPSGSSGSTVFAPGFRRISVLVNVTNPTCCDSIKYVVSYDDGGTTAEAEGILSDVSELPSEGSSGIIYHIESGPNAGFYMYINNSWTTVTIQHMLANDTQQLLPDYGMIALPETYTNTGEPTRLIIYCHGAAVNYADSVRGFNTQDLEPEYWLAEGYAVMDIEGNPFDNTNEHCQMPQAMDSYVAAYKWTIEHFNLKQDGVFLGGRSMGGGMTFSLMRRYCPIPVIAACPNAPALTMPLGSSDVRKTFWAEHCGFVLPEGFNWGTGLQPTENPVFLNNWEKWVKVLPLLSLITNLPTNETDKSALLDALFSSDTEIRWSYFESKNTFAKCPVKLFCCNQDASVGIRSVRGIYNMLINSANIVELRALNSYKDYSGTGTSAHHYDTQDPALRTTVTTRFGVEMTNVPIVYVEMLQFWRRYEQGN